MVSAYLTNKGKNVASIPDPNVVWYRHHISVIDEDDQQVPMAEYTKDLLKWGSVSSRAQHINPRETIEEKVNISEIFQLNRKGTYKITFKREVGIAGNISYALTSNTVTIRIIQ